MDETLLDTAPRAARTALKGRSRWYGRAFTVLLGLWTAFVSLNLLLSGRWWLWLLFSLVPPFLYLLGSFLLLVVSSCFRLLRGPVTIGLSVMATMLSFPQSGLVPQALWYSAPTAGEHVRVVAWNTEYWDQGEDPKAFYSFLRGMNADVYLLSEYINYVSGQVVPIDDRAALVAAFPHYQLNIKGQLVTLSRLPVVEVPATADADLLRVDVATPTGGRLSTYNLHVPAQLDPTASPFSSAFYTTLHQRDRDRAHCYQALRASALADPAPGVIAGDFNTTAAMGDLDQAGTLGSDAAQAGGNVLPQSWNEHEPFQFWKLDWMFVRGGLKATRYRLLDPQGTSDHSVQEMDAVVPGRR